MGYYEVFLSNSVDEPVSIFEPDIKELVLLNAKVMLNAKESGSFEFKMPPQHVFYDNVVPYGSSIEVFENGKSIFFGRPLTPRIDFWGSRQYHCEGALSFLNDVYLPPTDALGDSIAFNELLDLVLSEYNRTQTRFDRLMYCDLSEIPDTIIYEPEKWQYQSALNYLRDYMYQFVGGYFYAEKGVDWINLRWKKELTETNNQPVEFGVNLLDMTRIGQPFYTAAIAKGGEDENGTAAEMVEPRYLPDDLRTTYGTIEAHLEYPHLTTQAALIAECDKFLSNQQFSKFTFEVHAADQHLLNDSYEEYRIGQLVKVHSEYQGINVTLPITSLEIDLNSAIKKPTIGDLAIKTLTISIKKAKQETEKKAKEEAKEEAKETKEDPDSSLIMRGPDGNDYAIGIDIDPETNEPIVTATKIPKHIKLSPSSKEYRVGQSLMLSDFTVTAYYGDGTTQDVTSGSTFNLADGYVFVENDPNYQLRASYNVGGKNYVASARLIVVGGVMPKTGNIKVNGTDYDLANWANLVFDSFYGHTFVDDHGDTIVWLDMNLNGYQPENATALTFGNVNIFGVSYADDDPRASSISYSGSAGGVFYYSTNGIEGYSVGHIGFSYQYTVEYKGRTKQFFMCSNDGSSGHGEEVRALAAYFYFLLFDGGSTPSNSSGSESGGGGHFGDNDDNGGSESGGGGNF